MRFRSKPVEIEAVRWNGETMEVGDGQTPGWLRAAFAKPQDEPGSLWKHANFLEVFTLEGIHTARPGDWIICGTEGELYPCKPSVFERKYEMIP